MYSLVSTRCADGLAPSSFYLDVAVFLASVAYSAHLGHEFWTYGEQVIVLAQNVVLVLLVWLYSRPSAAHVALVTAAGAVFFAACALIPGPYLKVLPSLAIVASLGARVPQIVQNQRQRHTGALSVRRASDGSGGSTRCVCAPPAGGDAEDAATRRRGAREAS